MDFLARIKQGLKELEEQARLMEAQAGQGEHPLEMFPRLAGSNASTKKATGKRSKPKATAPRQGQGHPAAGERFETPSCPTQGQTPTRQAVAPASPTPRRLVDDLHGRLDEAFLLSEILGPPRSVRGWDDD